MSIIDMKQPVKLSIVIPCYNEENTLELCLENVLCIRDNNLSLEIIIVDDCSIDKSLQIAERLAEKHNEIVLLRHETNQGKGASLRTGFQNATGEFVAIQDADLEYDPQDLKKLLAPLVDNKADVVFGSRFLTSDAHRVLYFWHSLGNQFLTFLSNMFTDLNLTDMECCYKLFRREIIQAIDIEENRFGVEPEIVAKISQMRPRIFEMGISYSARTYEEGKKIGIRDGIRALYCIFHYNAHKAPLPVQFLIYLFIGGFSALSNITFFYLLYGSGINMKISVPSAFFLAAIINYLLCVFLLFRHKVRWNSLNEIFLYILLVCAVGFLDYEVTKILFLIGHKPLFAKMVASISVLLFNFYGRKYFVFPEPPSGPWKPQIDSLRDK